jgi:hypothetical protein
MPYDEIKVSVWTPDGKAPPVGRRRFIRAVPGAIQVRRRWFEEVERVVRR